MLKCYFVLREDINYSSWTLFKIALENTAKINHSEFLLNPQTEVLMIMNLGFLNKLENTFLNDGILFSWIEYEGKDIGLLIYPTDEDIRNIYLSDCMTLDFYASHRLKEFNELEAKRNKNKVKNLYNFIKEIYEIK